MSAARLTKAAIKIPKRIERGPTDILKALSSTVKYIPSEPEPTLQDDPFLLPKRQVDKKFFILSKLSGVKTAKFFLDKKPELFLRDDAEPKIEAFLPKEEFDPEMKFTEDDIKWCIEHKDPVNSVVAYTSMAQNEIRLSDDTLLRYFEMICYTNEENLINLNDLEQSRFLPDSDEQLVDQTWKKTGLAFKIFNQTKDLDASRVYSAMIAGLSKFNEHANAKEIFDEFSESHPGKALYLDAYNGLLKSVPRLYSSANTAHEATDGIVNHMANNLVRPDLLIFNSILLSYRSFKIDEETHKKAFQLFNDMKALNIEPSLASYASLIGIICKQRGGRNKDLVSEIIAQIEELGQVLEMREPRDLSFLSATMNIATNTMNDLKLAKRVHQIYLKNPNFFANHRVRMKFLDNYFKLLIAADVIENIMQFYNDYVPLVYQPSLDCVEALAEALDLYQAPESFVKKVGQDLVLIKYAGRIKNDAIFRKDPAYLDALEKIIK